MQPSLLRRLGLATAIGALALGGAALALPSAGAQTSPAAPDFSKYGFATVAGTASFTPGTAATVSAAGQTVTIPADFYSKPVTFELLSGTPSSFSAEAGGRQVLLAFAFRVTDTSTHQLVGKFDKPVQWKYTSPQITTQSAVYDVSAATPPTVVPNSVSPGAVSGQTIAHPFILDSVGWLVANPAGAASASPTAGALPATGTGGLAAGSGSDAAQTLALLLGGALFALAGAAAIGARRAGRSR